MLILVALVAAAAAGAVAGARWTLRVVEVHGESMEPGLWPGDRVLMRRLRPRQVGRRVRPGDVVVISRVGPGEGFLLDGGTNLVIKRVAAMAGDPVPAGLEALGEARVPPGRLLVLGDNARRSTDSRHWGFLPESRITGVVLRRLDA
ncbi:S26 family signal peptidase [Microbispora sp. NPDC049125]|uniref:S26 family signal peptidase n=1 Tax=Microbispora sp. NPDC049125 TaxID=3154929 RepID=UPI003465B31D